MTQGKTLALGMGVICTGAVVFMGFYLPFYSRFALEGQEGRRRLHQRAELGSVAPGGMWKNIQRKEEGVLHPSSPISGKDEKESPKTSLAEAATRRL